MKLVLQHAILYSSLFIGARLTGVHATLHFLRKASNDEGRAMAMTGVGATTGTEDLVSTATTTAEQQVTTASTSQQTTRNGAGCTNCNQTPKVQASNVGCAGGTGCGSTVKKATTKQNIPKKGGTTGCSGGACAKTVSNTKHSKSKASKTGGYGIKTYATGSKAPKSKSKSKSYGTASAKSKGSKGAKYASQCTSSYGCCVVNLADATTGSCVPGTKVEFKTADQTAVIDSFTVSSASQCSCIFAYGQQPAEHYCINVVPTSGNTCDGSCVTPLTTDTSSLITYINTKVVTTTTVTTTTTTNTGTQTTNSVKPSSTTGSVSVRLFLDHDKDTIQDTTDENLTGLQIKLIDTNLNEQTIISTCKDDVFLNVPPGKYTLTSQMAQGYACDCSKTVTVVAGIDSVVTIPYTQSSRK